VSGPAGTAAFLILLNEYPTLLDPAPADMTAAAAQMDHRAHGEIHDCLRCPGRAQVAHVIRTKAGLRWLDLCAGCAHWVRRANELGRDPTPAEI
jgi:hypothetical protein